MNGLRLLLEPAQAGSRHRQPPAKTRIATRREVSDRGQRPGVPMNSFVHLHNHTEYSMLDGAAKVKPMLAEAQRLHTPAIGMTDHGNMFGASEFLQQRHRSGHQADHRHRGLHRARVALRDQADRGATRARRPTTSRAAGRIRT